MTGIICKILDALLRREVIGLRNAEPYLLRWIVYKRKDGSGLYIHLFLGDDAADSHDHPKRFTSIGVWGSYDEEVFKPDHRWIHHRAPWFRSFGPMHRHRLVLSGGFCWTIVKVGPEIRDWGFYTPEGWVSWKKYEIGNHDIERRSNDQLEAGSPRD
jgi:hypothetical protein